MGIDQSLTQSGIVLLNDNYQLVSFECIKSKKDDFTSKFHRILYVANAIKKITDREKPNYIYIEGLPFGSISNITRDLAGLQAVIICKILDRNPIIIAPKSVKKYACDNGSATKTEMINALPSDVLNQFENDGFKKTTGLGDLADAFWIAKTGHSQLNRK